MGEAPYRLYRVWELFEERGYDDLVYVNYRLDSHGIFANIDDARRGADDLSLDEPMFRERVVVRIGSVLFLLDEEHNGPCPLADMPPGGTALLTMISLDAGGLYALCAAWELYSCSDEDETLLSTAIPGFVSFGIFASYSNAHRAASNMALAEHRIRDRMVVIPASTPFLTDAAHPAPIQIRRPRRRR